VHRSEDGAQSYA